MELSKAITGFKFCMSAGNYASLTIKSYINMLHRFLNFTGDIAIEDLSLFELRGFLSYLRDTGVSESTRQTYWKALKSFCRWRSEEFKLPRCDEGLKMPAAAPPEIIPYTEEEIKLLLSACEKTSVPKSVNKVQYEYERKTNARDKLIILLLLDTGVRVSELCRIRFSDIDIKMQSIRIATFETGRKSHERTVYFGSKAMKFLWRLIASRENSDKLLFETISGYPMNRDSVKKILQRLGERANVRNVGAHRFRHTFAIQYLRNGGDVFTLQRLTGHASLMTLQRYLNIANHDVKKAHKGASPVDNWRL